MERQFKIVVTVPVDKADELRDAIGKAGGGNIGDYSFCSFSIKGIGRFKPEKGARPSVGKLGEVTPVEEERIEVNCSQKQLATLIGAIKNNHPYEEPVIDVYQLFDGSQL